MSDCNDYPVQQSIIKRDPATSGKSEITEIKNRDSLIDGIIVKL